MWRQEFRRHTKSANLRRPASAPDAAVEQPGKLGRYRSQILRLASRRRTAHRHIAYAVSFVDMNTLRITLPTLSSGPRNLSIANPTGESISMDAAFNVN